MDLSERIARRQTRSRDDRILVDRTVLSPTEHLEEPVGRAPVLEAFLDAVDPVFEGRLPPELLVEGERGVGKSALVGSLFRRLGDRLGYDDAIATSTRASRPERWFVTIDCRVAATPFRFYQHLLEGLDVDDVPEHGVGTDELRRRVVERLSPPGRWAVLAVDHVEEAAKLDPADVREMLEPVADSTSTSWIGRSLDVSVDDVVHVEPYRHHALSDVLAHRCSRGLRTGAVEHDDLRAIAAWTDGNAHDGLAVALGSALLAEYDGAETITREHAETAATAVPDDTVHLDAVRTLGANRRRVLAELLALDPRPTVSQASTAIGERTSLSAGTVRRFCYELAEAGVLTRESGDAASRGRDPSHLVPAFPWLAFVGLEEGLSVADVVDRLDW